MKKEERELFKELSDITNTKIDESLLGFATPHVLGLLLYNRVGGIAYDRLKNNDRLDSANREFRAVLRDRYTQNIVRNCSYLSCIKELSERLISSGIKVAMLKGALLCFLYPIGCRVSNDIDLLVAPEDVTAISELLKSAGFVQGNVRNATFVRASRKEIIESKLTRGETVPFVKEVNYPGMKFVEVDINFSLDYKNSDSQVVTHLLSNRTISNINGVNIPTLDREDFFIHLCVHLYKEASTYPWILMRRDMTLYKYSDINLLISKLDHTETNRMMDRASALGLEKECSYAIIQTSDLFGESNKLAVEIAREVLSDDYRYLNRVINPKAGIFYEYAIENTEKRFFTFDRLKYLNEVRYDKYT